MEVDDIIQKFSLLVETDLNALLEVLNWLEQKLNHVVPSDLFFQCQIALTEGFTNAIIHAHRYKPKTTPIEIELKINPDSIEILIWDWGEPFNLTTKVDSLAQSKLDPLAKEGGLGLILMSRLMDQLSYTRNRQERNCLYMKKQIR